MCKKFFIKWLMLAGLLMACSAWGGPIFIYEFQVKREMSYCQQPCDLYDFDGMVIGVEHSTVSNGSGSLHVFWRQNEPIEFENDGIARLELALYPKSPLFKVSLDPAQWPLGGGWDSFDLDLTVRQAGNKLIGEILVFGTNHSLFMSTSENFMIGLPFEPEQVVLPTTPTEWAGYAVSDEYPADKTFFTGEWVLSQIIPGSGTVPEPGTVPLLFAALAVLVPLLRRKRR